MPTSRRGRLATGIYLLLVMGAVSTWVVAAFQQGAVNGALLGGFWATMVLTLPTGLLAYGLTFVGLAVIARPDGDLSLGGALLVLALFLGAAMCNVIMTRRGWRAFVDRRAQSGQRGSSDSPYRAA